MKHRVYRDGKLHVQKEMCDTCIFRPGNKMQLQRGRVKDMVTSAIADESVIACHKKLSDPDDAAICRGFFEKYPTRLLRLAEHLRIIREV